MLGARIRYLRQRQGLSQETLAQRAGMDVGALARIEEQATARVPPSQLTKLADGLSLKKAVEYMALLQLNGALRRCRVYCLGLPKTGTVSIKGVFGNYRTAHEFMQWDTHQMVIKRNKGQATKADLLAFLRDRDGAGCLEMDSAHFHRHYVDLLAEAYPDAVFVCLIRDCYSWLDSMINYFTLPDREAIQARDLDNGMPFDLPQGACEAKEELVRNFDQYIDQPLAHWGREYRAMLAKLPAERSIVIRTHEIADAIDRIARLAGVPPDTLLMDRCHLNKATYHVKVLSRYDPAFLQQKFDLYCKTLMDQFYPGYQVTDYQQGRPVASRATHTAQRALAGGATSPHQNADAH